MVQNLLANGRRISRGLRATATSMPQARSAAIRTRRLLRLAVNRFAVIVRDPVCDRPQTLCRNYNLGGRERGQRDDARAARPVRGAFVNQNSQDRAVCSRSQPPSPGAVIPRAELGRPSHDPRPSRSDRRDPCGDATGASSERIAPSTDITPVSSLFRPNSAQSDRRST